MGIITTAQMKTMKNKAPVAGVVLIKDYGTKATKNGKPYIDGTIMSGDVMSFKIWAGSLCDSFIAEDYSNCICEIQGEINEYQGNKSIILDKCEPIEGFVEAQFMKVVYDKEAYFQAFVNLVKARVSDKGYQLFDKLLLQNTELVERFKSEFAAKSHHDNCLSGLLAHSYKVVQLMGVLVDMYPRLSVVDGQTISAEQKDLYILGAALHDIGKTQEMEYGVYQPNSAVSHRFFGAEYLVENKEFIVGLYDEKWYYDLCSVMLQHHGEFGDPCATLPAMLVHWVDMLESRAQLVVQMMDANVAETKAGQSIKVDGSFITL